MDRTAPGRLPRPGGRPDTFAGCEYRSIYDVYPEESDTGWERWNRISYNILGRRTGQQNNSSGLQLGRGWQFDRYVIFAIPQEVSSHDRRGRRDDDGRE